MNKYMKYVCRFVILYAAFVLAHAGFSATLTSVTDPSTNFTTVPIISIDAGNDQQTGQTDADLVGIVSDPGFFTGFDGTNEYYRIRLGKASNGGNFKGLLWIGLDANNDGALDLLIGINNQGSTATIGFYAPGTGANTSPSTTTIQTGLAQYQTAESATNYNYQTVNSTIDPGLSNSDLNADGNTDVYLTIRVPLLGASGSATLQGAFAGLMGMSINQNTLFNYITATSTQVNSLNQDLGGVTGGINSSTTYQALGAMSTPITATGIVVPEPGTVSQVVLFGVFTGAFWWVRRCRPGQERTAGLAPKA